MMIELGSCLLMLGSVADSAADVVTLKDGSEVRGQIVESGKQGVSMHVRRSWAVETLPDRLEEWERTEAPFLKRARSERLVRLEAWRRDRRGAGAVGAGGVAIGEWIEEGIADLSRPEVDSDEPPLVMIVLKRGEIARVDRRPPRETRLLLQGWRAGFRDVETMAPDDLADSLRGRGFVVEGDEPVPIDDLLPLPIESDARWLARRAATEVSRDPGLRFINFSGIVMPEPVPGAALGEGMDVGGLLSGLAGSLLGDPAAAGNPLEPKLRAIGARGRVGAIVTRLELSPDLAGARVEMTLLARVGPERWEPVTMEAATVNSQDLPAGADARIAADPQVEAVFKAFDGLGLGGLDESMKGRSLAVGAATQRALGQARAALQADLDTLVLPVGEPGRP